jgi:hypothetical protein
MVKVRTNFNASTSPTSPTSTNGSHANNNNNSDAIIGEFIGYTSVRPNASTVGSPTSASTTSASGGVGASSGDKTGSMLLHENNISSFHKELNQEGNNVEDDEDEDDVDDDEVVMAIVSLEGERREMGYVDIVPLNTLSKSIK